MGIILQILLCFIAGCIGMMRGGSSRFPTIAEPFAVIDSESGKYKVPRWATVVMQLIIIVPFVIYYRSSPWSIPAYPIGWYLTIAWAYGDFFDCKTWEKRIKMFVRMCASIALFWPLAYIANPYWYSIFPALVDTIVFSMFTTLAYTLYNRQSGHTDGGFNWCEFAVYTVFAAMTFNTILG